MSAMLQPFLEAIGGDWQSHLQRDEWYFTRLAESIVSRLSANEAYEAIGVLSGVLLSLRDDTLVWAGGSLLLALSRCSDTTQMPPELASRWAAIHHSLSSHQDLAAQLAGWYRREIPARGLR